MSWRLITGTVALAVFLDQLTKYTVRINFERHEVLPVIDGFFNLILTYNPGAAFGLLANLPDGTRQLTLAVVTLLAVGLVLYFLFVDYRDDPYGQFALALILGGAIGNVIDRLTIGEVVDFLDFYWGEYHWPAFNLADSCICIGVALLIFHRKKESKEPSAPSEVESSVSK